MRPPIHASDFYPDRYRGEPTRFEQAARDDPLGVPDEVAFDIETTGAAAPVLDDVRRGLRGGGWSTDQVLMVGRLVATSQAAGYYYAGLLVPVTEDLWRLRLALVEEGR